MNKRFDPSRLRIRCADTLSCEERAAIAAYAGPVTRCPPGARALPAETLEGLREMVAPLVSDKSTVPWRSR